MISPDDDRISLQDTKIIGFDRREVQPDLTQSNLGIEYRDLSRRVVWVHGNLCVHSLFRPERRIDRTLPSSLDPLPFDSNHFDFIRICCIGLEVPEDSWQELLEVCFLVCEADRARVPFPRNTTAYWSCVIFVAVQMAIVL